MGKTIDCNSNFRIFMSFLVQIHFFAGENKINFEMNIDPISYLLMRPILYRQKTINK